MANSQRGRYWGPISQDYSPQVVSYCPAYQYEQEKTCLHQLFLSTPSIFDYMDEIVLFLTKSDETNCCIFCTKYGMTM